MLTCKEVARYVSESLDRDLPLRQRVGLRLHLAMCGMCRRYRGQMLLLRRAVQNAARAAETRDPPSGDALPMEARKRIEDRLRSA